jgi:hypothetical protein
VAKTQTWKIILALSAIFDLEIEQIDAIPAFLQGKLKDKTYIELPDGYCGADSNNSNSKDGDDRDVVRLLLQALYGLKQSPRL